MYILAGKIQYFLDRSDQPNDINIQNLRKAMNVIDKKFDKMVDKYFKDLRDLSVYLPSYERKKYFVNRKSVFINKLQRL